MDINLTPEAKEFLKRIEDKVKIVVERHQEQVTEFVDPYLRNVAQNLLNKIPDINYFAFGGVPDAERQRIIITPEYLEPLPEMAQLSILELTGKFDYVNVSHRDFLGAILGQGVKREKVGDIYLTEEGAVVILSKELAQFIFINPPKIKGVPLNVKEYKLGEWQPATPEGKEIGATVASLRLDALVAHGFGISRTKVSSFIKSGKVKVNWNVVEAVDYQCQKSDTISFRGKGRVIINEIGGQTKKGRIKVNMTRFQ